MTAMLPYMLILALVAAVVLTRGGALPFRAVAAFGLLTGAALAFAVDVMGRPKPVWAEFRDRTEIEVAAAQYHPGLGIYIWARSEPPVAYRLPWDVEVARQMQEAMRATGGAILRRGASDGGDLAVYPLPQAPNPPKEVTG